MRRSCVGPEPPAACYRDALGTRILLIEDDRELGRQIADRLRREGYEVEWWTEGRSIRADELAGVRLVILDLMLPGTYGMDILRELRPSAETPCLILSARHDTLDKVRALRLGADDYMTKPFWPDELVERIRARLRRPALSRSEVVRLGALRLDLEAHEVRVADEPVELTPAEFGILAALARKPGVVRTRAWLTERALGPDSEVTTRALDAHVSRLRKKLGASVRIETVWGIGYRLADDGDP
ncbi:MAG TPA: response regulator transcription factor [Polyangiaceae bacterium]|nr:response regulator transcription factor [Polyangiaceae bacterium]